jgi:hypothetical protein
MGCLERESGLVGRLRVLRASLSRARSGFIYRFWSFRLVCLFLDPLLQVRFVRGPCGTAMALVTQRLDLQSENHPGVAFQGCFIFHKAWWMRFIATSHFPIWALVVFGFRFTAGHLLQDGSVAFGFESV